MTKNEKITLFLKVVNNEKNFWCLYTKANRKEISRAKYYKWVKNIRAELKKKKFIKLDTVNNCLVLTKKGLDFLSKIKSNDGTLKKI